MILVDTDVSEDWDARTNWPALAQEAGIAAVSHSRLCALIDSDRAVELSVKFTDDSEVRALNAAFRNKDKPTNVLSFPMLEADGIDLATTADAGEMLLGDVVLAHGVCVAEAADRGISTETHASHLVVHGVLHLLGYDHMDDGQAEAMEQIEVRALASIGIPDPYQSEEVIIRHHG
jgi:probable rRNA maturation factor